MLKQKHLIMIVGITLGLLSVTMSNAQWLETTIYLPDSLGGVGLPWAAEYNPTNNKIYIGGENGRDVVVIDGATNMKIARIPAGKWVRALCYNSTNNKIYAASYMDHNITVIDGATNAVIDTIPVSSTPFALV